MERLERDSILLKLIETLRIKGSWCGETHVQKTVYFLQNLLSVPLNFDYVLYKHGPYSFDLSDALEQMRADGFLDLDFRPYPYGPSLKPDANSEFLRKNFAEIQAKYEQPILFLAEKLAAKNVAQLEQISTAMYVSIEDKDCADIDDRAKRITALKPHIPLETAKIAVNEFDKIRCDTGQVAA